MQIASLWVYLGNRILNSYELNIEAPPRDSSILTPRCHQPWSISSSRDRR
jgi:hypothetical protein